MTGTAVRYVEYMHSGWHPDPSDRRRLRYFDGVNWTADTAAHRSLRLSVLWPIAAVVTIAGALGPWTAGSGHAMESVGAFAGAVIALMMAARGTVDGRGCATAALGAALATVSAGWYLRWMTLSRTEMAAADQWGVLMAFAGASVLLLVICQQWSLWRQMDAITGPRSRRRRRDHVDDVSSSARTRSSTGDASVSLRTFK